MPQAFRPLVALSIAGLVASCQPTMTGPRPPVRVTSASPTPSPAKASPGVPVTSDGTIVPPGGTTVPPVGGDFVGKVKSGFTGLVLAPVHLIANNSGSLVSNNSGNFALLAAPTQAPLAGATVRVVDAAGQPVAGPDGQPLVTTTDAQGRYGFSSALPNRNLVVEVALANGLGAVRAIAPRGAAAADVDLISTLTTGYILDQYVQGEGDANATLERLPADLERDTRQRAASAFAGGTAAVPQALTVEQVIDTVEALRSQDAAFDDQLEAVKRVLVIGSKTASVTDGQAAQAKFDKPEGLALDAAGNLYVADTDHALIRKITPAGQVVTLAGTGQPGFADGVGAAAAFDNPTALAVDTAGNLYVADSGNRRIRKITPEGLVSTFAGSGAEVAADGLGTAAAFSAPRGLVFDKAGNLYVADTGPDWIRKITPAGQVSTIAGGGTNDDGPGPGAQFDFSQPRDLGIDAAGHLYVLDSWNERVCVIDLNDPSYPVKILAGTGEKGADDGPGTSATFDNPYGLTADAAGNVYVADTNNHLIRKITPTGQVTTLAGDAQGRADGQGTAAGFYKPRSLVVDSQGNLFVADTYNNTIRKVTPAGKVTTYAGTGQAEQHDGLVTEALFSTAYGVAVGTDGTIYVGDTFNHAIRKITTDGKVTTLAGKDTTGHVDGAVATATFNTPYGVAVGADGTVYVADKNNHRIRKITPAGEVSTLPADLKAPCDVAVGPGGILYVADTGNSRIRKIAPDGTGTTLAGSGVKDRIDGTGEAAAFYSPYGIEVDAQGTVYVADSVNDCIRKITPEGVVTTLAGSGREGSADGTGTAATFDDPRGIALDKDGNLYVADKDTSKIRKVTPAGVVTTLAIEGLLEPGGVAIAPDGYLVIMDSGNKQVRRVKLP